MIGRITTYSLAFSLMAATGASAAPPARNASYPPSVIAKCRGDYKRLCPQYKRLGTDLEACMRSSYRSISSPCMNSLVDAGLAPAFARRR